MRLFVLIGGPGSGKGTQCQKIVETFGWKHLSTGEVFRDQIRRKTKLGLEIQHCVHGGNLVPDDLVIKVVEEALSHYPDSTSGILLDGFPRTQYQAQQFKRYLGKNGQDIEKVIYLEAPIEILWKRLKKRGLEDGRADDLEEKKIRHRMKLYEQETQSLLNFYQQDKKLYPVPADQSVEEVFQDIQHLID
ncbi:MAG: adenylate kinase [Cytophagales bacterium]|nr:adenylate kinase [Cytophagales bacterium]